MLRSKNMSRNREVENLLNIINDRSADLTERDDALIALGRFDDNQVLDALVKVASDEDERSFIVSSAVESIAEILIRREIHSPSFLSALRRDAAEELIEMLAGNNS